MSEFIAHYEILGEIAAGSLGAMYRARDTRAGRTVAIRIVKAGMADPARRARALDLIQPFTAITHPHVATLFEAGERRGAIYLVYEYIPGEKLAAVIGGHPMNLRRALDLGEQVADALAEAHSLDLVHGSLTPASIVVTPKGHAKVLDFGLCAGVARDPLRRIGEAQEGPPGPGALDRLELPWVAYTAPEVLAGGPPGARSDLFALGAILHEMLTGRRAFPGRSSSDVVEQIRGAHPARPSLLNHSLPRELDAIVDKALAKDPERRCQAAAELAASLREAAAAAPGGAAAPAPTRRHQSARRAAPRRVAAALFLAAAVGASAWHWRTPLRQAWQARFGARPEPRLVVMPFQVTGAAGAERPYFGAGFAEGLAKGLGRVPGVVVLGRSMVRSPAGQSPRGAVAAAGAAAAVLGSVTPSDEDWTSLRIDARLVEAGTGRTAWSGAFTTGIADAMALQARMAVEIASRLDLSGAKAAGQGRAALLLVKPGAYDAYLRALDAMASNDASRAAQLFEAAADEDPGLADAQAGLALALFVASAFEGRGHFGDVQTHARHAAEAACAADPDSPSAWLSMGLTAPTISGAVAHLKRALELDASEAHAYLALAGILRPVDPDAALRFARRAGELDPGQPLAVLIEAAAHLSAGRPAEAVAAAERGRSLFSELPWWDAVCLRARLGRGPGPAGAPPPGTQPWRDAGDFPPGTILRAAELAGAGRTGDALTLLGSLTRLHPGSCEARAMTAAVLLRAGRMGDAQRLASAVWSRAAAAPDGSGWSRCAYMAAAALNEPARAAAWLARAASSERELRGWGAVSGVLDGLAATRDGVFPWSNVSAAPAVAESAASLRAAMDRTRAETARVLQGS
ncbi:MAG TPA: protein kinase [Vicinamibacterales bacterium]|nr:protein kinase [Vicinamibacterales bacterium]HPK70469.1 protein kinase [Vicinamibacterales bacterium]